MPRRTSLIKIKVYILKKFCILALFCFFLQTASSATTCTEYLSQIYSNAYSKNIKISSQKEFIEKYEQTVDQTFISSIVYGKGYFMQDNARKKKITYICTMKNDAQAQWGHVIPKL